MRKAPGKGSKSTPVWVPLLRYTGMGWYIAIAIALGVAGGAWLDNKVGWEFPLFLFIGLFVGLASALWGVLRMLKAFSEAENQKGGE